MTLEMCSCHCVRLSPDQGKHFGGELENEFLIVN